MALKIEPFPFHLLPDLAGILRAGRWHLNHHARSCAADPTHLITAEERCLIMAVPDPAAERGPVHLFVCGPCALKLAFLALDLALAAREEGR